MDANGMRKMFLLGYEAARLANRTFNDREIQDFLNKAQLELIKQRFAAFRNSKQIGMGGNPMIPQSAIVRASELAGLMTATSYVWFDKTIQGSGDNGALMGPDLDAQNNATTAARYGVFAPLPDEALYVLYETVNTCTDSSFTNIVPGTENTILAATGARFNVPVLEVDYTYYGSGIYDDYAKPYHSLVWSMDWGSYTTASLDTGSYTDSTKEYSSEGTGYNMTGTAPDGTTDITINTIRSRYLLPGKDQYIVTWKPFYLKRPADIVIDINSPSRQVSCQLADFLHQEIVDLAVKLASAAIVPEQGKYQINQVESKEDE